MFWCPHRVFDKFCSLVALTSGWRVAEANFKFEIFLVSPSLRLRGAEVSVDHSLGEDALDLTAGLTRYAVLGMRGFLFGEGFQRRFRTRSSCGIKRGCSTDWHPKRAMLQCCAMGLRGAVPTSAAGVACQFVVFGGLAGTGFYSLN